MNCPYCFRTFKMKKRVKGSRHVYYCMSCESEIHRAYVEFPKIPLTRIGLVGYTGHGKTVYITSLFYMFQALDNLWKDYYFETFDDFTHEIMFEKVPILKSGKLFSGTPINFPEPAFIRLNNMPYFDDQIISLYDIGGGVFDDLDLMTQKGKYLAHSDTIFFIISLLETDVIDDWNLKIMKLLDRYIHVVYSRFGLELSQKQNLVFVFSKADQLVHLNEERALPKNLIDNLNDGHINQLTYLSQFSIENIVNTSDNIKNWLRGNNCNGFINLAENHFKNVNFVLASALGNAPVNNELKAKLTVNDPKNVFDPLLIALNLDNKAQKKNGFFSFLKK